MRIALLAGSLLALAVSLWLSPLADVAVEPEEQLQKARQRFQEAT